MNGGSPGLSRERCSAALDYAQELRAPRRRDRDPLSAWSASPRAAYCPLTEVVTTGPPPFESRSAAIPGGRGLAVGLGLNLVGAAGAARAGARRSGRRLGLKGPVGWLIKEHALGGAGWRAPARKLLGTGVRYVRTDRGRPVSSNPIEEAVLAHPAEAELLRTHYAQAAGTPSPLAGLWAGYSATLADPALWPHPALVEAVRAHPELAASVSSPDLLQDSPGSSLPPVSVVNLALSQAVTAAAGVLAEESRRSIPTANRR